ncbi:bifunctional glutamate--cysteine ligase GshA/glutathione synthetase GshB [Leptospira sp. 96542]|nr:bifunctional glutamate--cysteine ligase GshA/glutathione synthetase GshB [Leptospira sp. 96542]
MPSFEDLPDGYEDMEISTQIIIRDALARGISVDVIDRSENFIRLTKGSHSEFIKEASKTRLDSLMTYLVMENKVVSKLVLGESGVRVPFGRNYESIKYALSDYNHFKHVKKVIKPTTTNFGLGIGISQPNDDINIYEKHLNHAFSYSGSVIVEEFIEGPEYRFLVLGGEVVAVCNRVPANVLGDGENTIETLVHQKNKDPRRGEGHKTALEKIQMTEIEKSILNEQGMDFDSIPKKGQTVFLRKNSNISTGGDSLDVTDLVHPEFKTIAIMSAATAEAKICGIDIISSGISEKPDPKTYAILEINFNPVLYIHEFPYSGTKRRVGEKILNLLGF